MKKILLIGMAAAVVMLVACNQKKDKKEMSQEDRAAASSMEKDITNLVLADLKVSDIQIPKENKPIACRNLRLRRLDVVPGGKIGIHSHENRPAILGIVRGKGMSMHAYGHEPLDVLYGEAYKEYNAVVHYAFNLSKTDTLSLITFDFLDDGTTCNGHSYKQNTVVLDKMRKDKNPFFVNAPKGGDGETNHPIYSFKLADIEFPKEGLPIQERSLRMRKITLGANTTMGVQDFSNRPTYIMAVEGTIEVKNTNKNTTQTLARLETANLINTGKIEIKNPSKDEKATYFVMELYDANDEN